MPQVLALQALDLWIRAGLPKKGGEGAILLVRRAKQDGLQSLTSYLFAVIDEQRAAPLALYVQARSPPISGLFGLIQKDADRVRVPGAGDDEIRHLIAGRMK